MANNAQTAFNEMLPWFAALLAFVLVGGAVLFFLRRRMLGPSDSGDVSRGILEEIRELRDRGAISQDEYETARLKMVARASGRDFEELKAESIRKAGGVVAEPGRDLLGRPLPEAKNSGPDGGGRADPESGQDPQARQE